MFIGFSARNLWSLMIIHLGRSACVLLYALLWSVNTPAQNPEQDLASAHSLLEQNKNAEAIAQLKVLAARNPEMNGVSQALGIAYYREGEYLDAAKYLQDAWSKNPEDRDVAQLLGLSLYSIGKPAEAIAPLQKVHLWHPQENMDAMYVLGLCYILTKNYSNAREIFAQLYGLESGSAEAHLLLARMMLRQGFDPIGEEEAHKALSISPKLPLAHFTLGEFDVYKGDYARAATEFQNELAINAGYAPALTHLGDVYWHLGRTDDAEKVLRRSIWLDSTRSDPYVVLGKVLSKKGQLVLAERALERAVSIDPGNYMAHYSLGQLYREQGKTEAAQREMKTAARVQQQEANGPRN
jgi:tetratricopeptide (TPR) repeat protein